MDVLREIFVLLGMKTDEKSFEKSMLAVEAVKKGAEGIIAGFEKAGHALYEALVETGKLGEEVLNLSARTGIATDTLQEYGAIAKAAGLSNDAFAHGMRGLAMAIGKAERGSDDAVQAFAKLGVKTKDAAGKTRPMEDILGDISDHFEKMPDGAEKLALSMQVLGRGGGELIPILNKGSAELEKMRHHIRELGIVMSKEMVENAAAFDDSLDDLSGSLIGLRNEITGPLLKPLKQVIDQVWKWVVANKEVVASGLLRFLKMIGGLFSTVGRVVQPFVEAFLNFADTAAGSKVIFAGFLVVLAALAAGFLVAAAAAWTFVAGEIAAAAPILATAAAIGVLLAAVGLLVEDIYTYFKGGRSLFGKFIDGLKEIGSVVSDTMAGWIDRTVTYWKTSLTRFLEWLGGKFDELPEPLKLGLVAAAQPTINAAAGGLQAAQALGLGGLGGGASTPASGFAGAPGGQSLLAPQFRANFSIQTTPGMDNAAVGTAVRESLDDWWNAKLNTAFEATVGQYSTEAR